MLLNHPRSFFLNDLQWYDVRRKTMRSPFFRGFRPDDGHGTPATTLPGYRVWQAHLPLSAHMVIRMMEHVASPPRLPQTALRSATPRSFTDGAIRYIMHLQERALKVPREERFDGLSTSTSDQLIERLVRDLERLEAELDRQT